MIDIKELNEELEKIIEGYKEEDKEEEESINGLKLVPHGEYAVKYYDKTLEYIFGKFNLSFLSTSDKLFIRFS